MSEEIGDLMLQNERMKNLINDFITEYCDRSGPEDYPIEAKDQSCPIISRAMMLMNLLEE